MINPFGGLKPVQSPAATDSVGPADWTQRTESTLLVTACGGVTETTTTVPMIVTSATVLQDEESSNHKERDPRLTRLSARPCPYEVIPVILRQYFHEYTISRALGLPYLSIAIIDTISDYLYASAPTVGSRDFKFEHYYLAENRARKTSRLNSDSDHFLLSFPFSSVTEQSFTRNEEDERYHELTAIGERDEECEERGELINKGDLIDVGDRLPQRRLWSIFADKSRDEIRLEDYRAMSEAELDGSLCGPEVEVLDEWGRRCAICESHWTLSSTNLRSTNLIHSRLCTLSDSNTQITYSGALDDEPIFSWVALDHLAVSNPPIHESIAASSSSAAAASQLDDEGPLYEPTLTGEFGLHRPTEWTTINQFGNIYSFQLNIVESDMKKEKARICYFGFGNKFGGGTVTDKSILPLLKVTHHIDTNRWSISTVNSATEPGRVSVCW